MRTPGTIAFLLRWQTLPLTIGTALMGIAAYQLWNYEAPVAPPSAGLTSPVLDLFLPAMWLCLFLGSYIVGRCIGKARGMAGK